jgi:hypothetical protein
MKPSVDSVRAPFLLSLLLVLASACGDDDVVSPDAGPPDAGPADGNVTCARDVECSNGIFCDGVERCMPDASAADARGCVAATAPACDEGTTCDEATGRCALPCGANADADGDGFDAAACGGSDCDDTDATRYPGATEVCDGDDEDCDPTTFGSRDDDRDGFVDAACCNGTACGEDCNDARRNQHPLATEVCDRIDNDCDGLIDEGVSIDGFADRDGDGHGDPAAPMTACAGTARFSALDDDCDDTRPSVHAAQVEVCDLLDNDCDGLVDDDARATIWYEDADGDGFGSLYGETRFVCEPPVGFSLLATDCDDTRATANPAADELCNARDDDCNGSADFEVASDDFEDDDRDGHADVACPTPGDDCDDTDSAVFTGASEYCDTIDNDCDGAIDEGVTASDLYVDIDGDGYGAGTPFVGCMVAGRLVPRGGDCDDRDAATSPGASEACNGRDDDCNGIVDDGAEATCGLPSATGVCSAGECAIATCSVGFADCDHDRATGCETVLATDLANCGACGNDCTLVTATSCVDGSCVGGTLSNPGLGGVLGFTMAFPVGMSTPISIDGSFPARSTMTDSTGVFSFYLLALGPYVLRVDPSPFIVPAELRPTLIGVDATAASPGAGTYFAFQETRVGEIFTQLGRTESPRKGIVVVYGTAGGVVPYRTTVSLSSPSDPGVIFDPGSATWVPGTGTIYEPEPVVFTNVSPGPVSIVTGGACYLSNAPSTLPVRPGMITVFRIGSCAYGPPSAA